MAETPPPASAGDRQPAAIPAFINERAGTADKAVEALERERAFDVRPLDPARLADEIRAAVAGGASRVLVAGGDGTVRSAAAVVAHTSTELAVLPGGTLNHFARDHGIPVDAGEAVAAARDGTAAAADAAYANDRLFLNTSTIGAYVLFARTRERYEKYLGYYLASVVAAIRILARLPVVRVALEVEGAVRHYETPALFIGVGERELRFPDFGNRVEDGTRALHVMVLRSRSSARLFAIVFAAATRGIRWLSRTPHFDAFLVDRCSVELPGARWEVAADGEIERFESSIEYRIERDAIRVVVPAAGTRDA